MCLITFWENPITLLPVRFLAALIHCSSCSLNPELISCHVQQARSREPTIDLRRPLNISIHLFQLFHASWNVSTDFYHQDNWSRIHGEQRKAFWSRFSQVNKDSSRRKRNAHGTHETDCKVKIIYTYPRDLKLWTCTTFWTWVSKNYCGVNLKSTKTISWPCRCSRRVTFMPNHGNECGGESCLLRKFVGLLNLWDSTPARLRTGCPPRTQNRWANHVSGDPKSQICGTGMIVPSLPP